MGKGLELFDGLPQRIRKVAGHPAAEVQLTGSHVAEVLEIFRGFVVRDRGLVLRFAAFVSPVTTAQDGVEDAGICRGNGQQEEEEQKTTAHF